MSLLAEGESRTIVGPLGSALVLVPNFNRTNIPLAEWDGRLERAACLYQVPTQLIVELAINSFQDDTH